MFHLSRCGAVCSRSIGTGRNVQLALDIQWGLCAAQRSQTLWIETYMSKLVCVYACVRLCVCGGGGDDMCMCEIACMLTQTDNPPLSCTHTNTHMPLNVTLSDF